MVVARGQGREDEGVTAHGYRVSLLEQCTCFTIRLW